MKLQSLCLFIVFLSLFNIAHGTESTFLNQMKMSLSGYFFLQKVYRGDDPLILIRNSQQTMALKYFTLNDKNLAYSATQKSSKNVEEGVQLSKLYDAISDQSANGNCCKNVQFTEFPGCKGASCPKSAFKNLVTPQEIAANYCVEIKTHESYLWRVCSDNQTQVSQFFTKLSFNIISLHAKGKLSPKTLEKFLLQVSNKKSGDSVTNWHWDDQINWKGECANKSNLQSPIQIDSSKLTNKSQRFVSKQTLGVKYGIEYAFEEVFTLVKKHYNEHHVQFTNSAGVLKLWVDNTYLVYQPQYLSFRFPGEHVIDGKRYEGEVLIHFTEMNPNRKTWVTNGLILSIPLNPQKDSASLNFFDDLNPDFWKIGTKKTGVYEPKKNLNKTRLKFSLQSLARKATSLNPTYFTYIGSESVPPCTPNILYVIVNKAMDISTCQFKVIRENSLLTDRPKEIHARLPQDLQARKVYEINQITFAPKVKALVALIRKSFVSYIKMIRKIVGKNPAKSTNPLAMAFIKTPIKISPKAIKKHLEKLKKKHLKALYQKGPEAKKMRQEAKAAIKAQSDQLNC